MDQALPPIGRIGCRTYQPRLLERHEVLRDRLMAHVLGRGEHRRRGGPAVAQMLDDGKLSDRQLHPRRPQGRLAEA